jgi:hypothetical protein
LCWKPYKIRTCTLWAERIILGAFARLRKVTVYLVISVCLSVWLSTWNTSASTGRIFYEILCLGIFRKSVEKIQVSLKSDNNSKYFAWRHTYIYDNISMNFSRYENYFGAWGSVVVKALRYKSEGPGIDSRCRRNLFLWHMTFPCALGLTQPLRMSTRLILGVKAAGA